MEARRRDGFEGAIDVALTGAPEGWALGGGRIPAGRESVRVTLTAPAKPVIGPVYLRFEARAAAGDGEIRRAVIPAEDVMQAFLWRHLVPSREFAALVAGRGAEPVEVLTDLPVRIAAGKTALVRVRVPPDNASPSAPSPPSPSASNRGRPPLFYFSVDNLPESSTRRGLPAPCLGSYIVVRPSGRRRGRGPRRLPP